MPWSVVQNFTDPDDYAEAIGASTAEVTVSGRGMFTAKLTGIRLHRLWTQSFLENLPRTLHSAIATERAIVSFRTRRGPDLIWSGAELQASNIIRHVKGEHASSVPPGPLALPPYRCRWGKWFQSEKRLPDLT
jgi:hypothetical protein